MNLLKNVTKKIDLPSIPASTQREVKFSFSIIKDWVTYFTDVLNTIIDFLNTYIVKVEDVSLAHIIATEAHGATGAVVGTTNEQTILNKTLVSPKINNIVSTTTGGILLESNTGTDIALLGSGSSDTSIFYGNVIAPTAEFGDTSNKTVFESDGTLVSNGAATTWNDIFIDGLSTTGGTTDPPVFAAFMGGVWVNKFINAATNSSHASLEFQHDYKEGSNFNFHIHWSPSTTNVGNVRWGIEYTMAPRNGVFPATTTVNTTLASGGVANAHKSDDIAVIVGTGVTIGTVLRFRIFRLGADILDTFTGDVFLHRIGIHYECDTMGSRQITTK